MHIVLSGGDFVMCTMIYNEYFGGELSEANIIKILGCGGVLIVAVGGGGYAIAKSATGLVAEFANFLGPLGWMASGLLAAGGTAALGLIWMGICEYAYSKGVSMERAAKAVA